MLAAGVLLTNLVLRPLAYRLHPILPEAAPVETLYEFHLPFGVAVAAHVRSLLLATIGRLLVIPQSIHAEQDE